MSNTVITSSDLQVKYEKLYKFLMNFLWEFAVVQDLATLEIAIFKRFPDKDEMLNALRDLNFDISHTYTELAEDDDVEFKEAYEDLEEAINEFENPGCELYSVEEYHDDTDDVAASDDLNAPDTGKRKFAMGDITKTTAEEKALQEEAANTLSNPFEEGEE